jgi:hypothetical protein
MENSPRARTLKPKTMEGAWFVHLAEWNECRARSNQTYLPQVPKKPWDTDGIESCWSILLGEVYIYIIYVYVYIYVYIYTYMYIYIFVYIYNTHQYILMNSEERYPVSWMSPSIFLNRNHFWNCSGRSWWIFPWKHHPNHPKF